MAPYSVLRSSASAYVGPWKFTYAASAPHLAHDFAIRYLDAEPAWSHKGPCHEFSFVTLPLHRLVESPAEYRGKLDQFQLHFTRLPRRPTGPMQIHMFEEGMTSFGDVCSHAQNGGTISAFDPLYDTRLQLAADDLDPIASLLVIDKVPFFAKTNRDGTHSIILRIAHSAAVVEILSSKLTVLKPHVWRRCHSGSGPFMRPPVINWARLHPMNASRGQQGAVARARVTRLRPLRCLFASNDPMASAMHLSKHFLGKFTAPPVDLRDSCVEARAVRWVDRNGSNAMEFVWVRWAHPVAQRRVRLHHEYQLALRGNFSARGPNRWDHYMDYHAGLLIDDCEPLVDRLRKAAVPHFLAMHFKTFVAVFFTDPDGSVFEVTCYRFSHRRLRVIPNWQFCANQGKKLRAAGRLSAVAEELSMRTMRGDAGDHETGVGATTKCPFPVELEQPKRLVRSGSGS